MHAFLFLGCFILTVTEYFLGSAHMIYEEKLSTNKVVTLPQTLDVVQTPVLIVEMTKSRKNKKTNRQKKNKLGVKNRPPPPADCIPSGGNCKSPGRVCCDYCAFCQCRLFRTVCYCRVGNPRC